MRVAVVIAYNDNKSSARIPLQEFIIFQLVQLCSKNIYDIFIFLLSPDENNVPVMEKSYRLCCAVLCDLETS